MIDRARHRERVTALLRDFPWSRSWVRGRSASRRWRSRSWRRTGALPNASISGRIPQTWRGSTMPAPRADTSGAARGPPTRCSGRAKLVSRCSGRVLLLRGPSPATRALFSCSAAHRPSCCGQAPETLAGRIAFHTLDGFDLGETARGCAGQAVAAGRLSGVVFGPVGQRRASSGGGPSSSAPSST